MWRSVVVVVTGAQASMLLLLPLAVGGLKFKNDDAAVAVWMAVGGKDSANFHVFEGTGRSVSSWRDPLSGAMLVGEIFCDSSGVMGCTN